MSRSIRFVAQLFLVVSVFLVVSATLPAAHAETANEDLPPGATLPDVIKAWGQPLEKIEKGIKREVVWRYPQGAFVVFKDGKAVNWRSLRGRTADQGEKALVASTVDTPAPQPEMGDLVRDIAREVPGGPDVPYSEPPPAQPPGLIPNPAPGGGRPAVEPEDLEADQ